MMLSAQTLPRGNHEDRDRHQPGCKKPGFRLQHPFPGRGAARAAPGHRRQHRAGGQAAAAVGQEGRRHRPGPGQGQRQHEPAQPGRRRQAGRTGAARAGEHRGAAVRPVPGVGRSPHAEHAGPLLRQRARAVHFGPEPPEAGDVDGRVHAEPAVRRPTAAAGRAQAAGLDRRLEPVCQRRALRVGMGAAAHACGAAAQAVVAVRAAQGAGQGHRGGGAGARARRLRARGAGRQDRRHDHRQRRAAGAVPRQGRAPGGRRRAAGGRPRGRPVAAGRDDPGRHRQGPRRPVGRRLRGDPRQPGAGAAAAVPQRLQAREPLRLRHPPAVAGVLQGRQAGRDAVARVAAAADGQHREGDGLCTALRLFARRRHPQPDRRRGRGLADLGRRHAQGDHEPQPRVHLSAAAGRRRHGQEAGGADHGPGRLHQGGGRRRRDGGAARAAAHHHRQQLQRVGRAVGGARRTAAHGPAAAAARQGQGQVQGHGGGRHRRHRLGLRAALGACRGGGLPGVAGDRQAAGAEGFDPEGNARRQGAPGGAR